MDFLNRKIYVAAGYVSTFMGPGRNEFQPQRYKIDFESYLQEVAVGSCRQLAKADFDEGVIGSFMSARFLRQANLSGFLPFMLPSLRGRPCLAVEGACATGSQAVITAIKSILSGLADSVFVVGFEMQNAVKPVYGADFLAGASYYAKRRKEGSAYFFPGMFSHRAGEYFRRFGHRNARKAMAKWYEQAILKARKNSKAQEYHNVEEDLVALALEDPRPDIFLEHLNFRDCSKVSDGAASVVLLSEEGLKKCGVKKEETIEVISFAQVQEDITKLPDDGAFLATTRKAAKRALFRAGIAIRDIGLLEIHDCFTITALLSFEALGFAAAGKASDFILEGRTLSWGDLPTNPSGGLIGFGHPTGATGVRQLADLWQQLTLKAENQVPLSKPYAMMVNMGGDDKTVAVIVVKAADSCSGLL